MTNTAREQGERKCTEGGLVWGHGRHHGARRVVAPRGVGEAPRGGDRLAALARVPQGQLELGQPSRTSFRSFPKMKENKKKNTTQHTATIEVEHDEQA